MWGTGIHTGKTPDILNKYIFEKDRCSVSQAPVDGPTHMHMCVTLTGLNELDIKLRKGMLHRIWGILRGQREVEIIIVCCAHVWINKENFYKTKMDSHIDRKSL